jgi:hypothetical protein
MGNEKSSHSKLVRIRPTLLVSLTSDIILQMTITIEYKNLKQCEFPQGLFP